MIKIHNLKCWPEYFQEVWDGNKPWEFRKNDREFQRGDVLILGEWNPTKEEYTGRVIVGPVVYMLQGPAFGLHEDYCIMSFPSYKKIDSKLN